MYICSRAAARIKEVLPELERMKPKQRKVWLRESWGLEIQYSNPPAPYPMDIVKNGKRIGGIVRTGDLVILALPGIGDFEGYRACGPDALEIWEHQGFEFEPEVDLAAKHINTLIFQLVGTWAERQAAGTS